MSAGPGVDERTTLGIAFGLLGVAGCALLDAWAGIGAAQALAGHGWQAPALSPQLALTLATGGLDPLLTGASPTVCWAVIAVLSVVELGGGIVAWLWISERLRGWHDPSRLARRSDLGELAGTAAAKKAVGLRPSLAGGAPSRIRDRDRGIRLLRVHGQDVYMSWEDVALIIMGPRSNKTSAVVVPTILSAPGPVVATSNKADVWSLTRDLRAAIGPTWTFDPMQVGYAEQTFYLDPVGWIRSEPEDRRLEHAARFIAHFMSTVSGGNSDPFFTNAGERVATGAVLAAAAAPQGSLRDVLEYLADGRREAVAALDAYGAHQDAAELENTLAGAHETSEGIYETARTGLRCLRSEALLRWVTPPHTWRTPPPPGRALPEFDPWTLFLNPETPATVYLLSKDGGGGAAPLVTALVDRITDCAERTAQARGGRLDPSLSLVLDESANICPLRSLPAQFSHWGSRGIQCLAILQNYSQGVRVWDRDGMDALWSASTVKLVGAGLEDVDFLGRISQLAGEHYVQAPSQVSRDRRGGGSESFSQVKEPIFPISTLRALPKTDALLLTPGRRVAHGTLLPWYREDVFDVASGTDISAANAAASEEIRTNAVQALGRDNPVARALDPDAHRARVADPL